MIEWDRQKERERERARGSYEWRYEGEYYSITLHSYKICSIFISSGGILHIHEIAMANITWVVKNITYLPHLFYCVNNDSSLQFNFSTTPPTETPPGCVTEWVSVASARAEMGAELFDEM